MTDHVHWWLVGLAFALGMILTFALMVRPAKYQVPVGYSTGGTGAGGAKSRPPTKKTSAADSRTKKIAVAKGSPTKKVPATKRSPTAKDSVTKESAKHKIPVANESPTTHIPTARFAPYGPGSARADADGGGPEGWLVKGRSGTRLYYTPDDPSYDAIVAQVWFQDEGSAARAFFTPWRKSARRKRGSIRGHG